MAQPQIKFQGVNIYVTDMDKALFFYRRIGFVPGVTGDDIISLKLSEHSDFVIFLRDAEANDRQNGEITIGLGADGDSFQSYKEVFLDLLYRGFIFSNLEPYEMYGDTVFDIGVIEDPNGVELELTYDKNEG